MQEELTMTSNADKLEDKTAEILGQIQASVAEYVRTMNEAGALRRREADEAQRQQDQALQGLKTLENQGRAMLKISETLSTRAANDWLGLVDRGLREIALAQAKEATSCALSSLKVQTDQLTLAINHANNLADQIALRNERICRSLAWKALAVAAVWFVAIVMATKIFVVAWTK
jgi:hypothetical protein